MGLIVETEDLNSTVALLSDLRGVVRIRSLGGQVGVRLARHTIGPVGMDRTTFGMNLDADVDPSGLLVFGRVISGTVGFRTGTAERWHTEGGVYLAAQPGQGRTSMVRGGEYEQTVIDPAFLSKVAQTGPDRSAEPVRFTGYEPVSAQAAGMWRTTCGYVRDTVLASETAGEFPLLAANAARLLAATALAVFPNDARADASAEDRHSGSPATLRRAVAFIDEHAHEDIAAADIAAAACVTTRAVQLAFRRHLNDTPMEYLRQVRLDHAHRQLVAADPEHESVTAVAYRWGFPSPSRFAAAYRKAYGVPPSRSLRG